MGSRMYSAEELQVLKSIFDSCDPENTGKLHINQIPGLLTKLGKNDGESSLVLLLEEMQRSPLRI